VVLQGFLLFILSTFGFLNFGQADPICRPFALYRGMTMPKAWRKSPHDPQSCLSYYANQDTDGDGTPDWNPLYDGEPSLVLYPKDPDMDGDGTLNLLDPDPLDSKVRGESHPLSVPPHLRIHRALAARFQNELFSEFGIVAVDHTDDHSPLVLKSLLTLLRQGFPKGFHRRFGVQAIYAFSGHDSEFDLAAFHKEAGAISIGGVSVYGSGDGRAKSASEIRILASLAHEIGHAFIFDRMTAPELREASEKFGGWGALFDSKKETPLDLYSPVFFLKYPNAESPRFSSSYAATGIHEWFSDSFAALALSNLGRGQSLGSDWKNRLVAEPTKESRGWFDYNRVPVGFASWVEEKLEAIPKRKAGRYASPSQPASLRRPASI
jgi:hypothetical protein